MTNKEQSEAKQRVGRSIYNKIVDMEAEAHKLSGDTPIIVCLSAPAFELIREFLFYTPMTENEKINADKQESISAFYRCEIMIRGARLVTGYWHNKITAYRADGLGELLSRDLSDK